MDPSDMVQPRLFIAPLSSDFLGKSLMIQGTTSDAGKSMLVTALCRVLDDRGIRVAPFKPQNMALNSAVTACGGEIGRSTATQAAAARQLPTVDMNPVLLKPSSDTEAQVIIQGKALSRMEACDYIGYKVHAKKAVFESFNKLHEAFDAVVIEGAGSPAEVNLRQNDIANMGFAEQANVPVVIVADIDRGGVFAQLIGTMSLLSASEQSRVIGFIINKFRGDISLLENGVVWLERQTGRKVFGVLPYLHGLEIAEEDAVNTTQQKVGKVHIVVTVLPRMSNHNDFDLMRHHSELNLEFCYAPSTLPSCDLIFIPGSKNTREDLEFLKFNWGDDIARHLRYGGKVFGVCGGLQMLGETIDDLDGVEGPGGVSDGLGYLPIRSALTESKTLKQVKGMLTLHGEPSLVNGYEIHCGLTQGDCRTLFESADGACLGFVSDDGQVAGSYWHGLFEEVPALNQLVGWLGKSLDGDSSENMAEKQQRSFDRLAKSFEENIEMNELMKYFY